MQLSSKYLKFLRWTVKELSLERSSSNDRKLVPSHEVYLCDDLSTCC